jgi:hypothetical protein
VHAAASVKILGTSFVVAGLPAMNPQTGLILSLRESIGNHSALLEAEAGGSKND